LTNFAGNRLLALSILERSGSNSQFLKNASLTCRAMGELIEDRIVPQCFEQLSLSFRPYLADKDESDWVTTDEASWDLARW